MSRPAFVMIGGDVFANGSPCIHMTPADVLAELEVLTDEINGANACQDFVSGLNAARRAADLMNARGACEQYHELLTKIRSTAQ